MICKVKISVIIPVYNVEKYVIPCLESVKNQTFKEFEAIIVNDGSTDNSLDIVNDYISKNSIKNFFVISQKNQGLSASRNHGMDIAKGEWLFFLDADDWVENNALELLVESAEKYNSDLVIGGYQAVDDVIGKTELWSNYPYEYGKIPEEFNGLHSFGFCWGRLFKRKIVEDNILRFEERVAYAEDNAWQLDYNRFVKTYSCVNDVVYNYRINREGALTKGLVTPRMKYFLWEHLIEFINSFEIKDIKNAIKTNISFNRVVWGTVSTAIINDILDKKHSQAKSKLKMEITQTIIQEYKPRTKKDKLFLFLLKNSFLLLCVFVRVYYSNFEKLRKSRLLQNLSKSIKK